MSRRLRVSAAAVGAMLSLVGATAASGTPMVVAASASQTAETGAATARGAVSVEAPAGLAASRAVFGSKTLLVSQSSTGQRPADTFSTAPDISGDGRFVVFESAAPNLVPGDTNGRVDVFLRDLVTRTTTRINLTSAGQQSSFPAGRPSISADGRYVAFSTGATDIDPADTNTRDDVYLYDRVLGTARVLTVDPATGQAFGSRGGALSLDGDHLVFVTSRGLDARDVDGARDIYLLTISTGQYTLVSVERPGLGGTPRQFRLSGVPSVDAHGDRVMFDSVSPAFVPRDTNGDRDVFVRDLRSGTTTRVSLTAVGKQLPANSQFGQISGNGQVVTFSTGSDRVVPGDHNGRIDIFARNLRTGRTRIVSVGSNEQSGNGRSDTAHITRGDISRDGRVIVFASRSTNFVPRQQTRLAAKFLFVRDMGAGTTKTCVVGVDGSVPSVGGLVLAALSADGKHVAFSSQASTLVRPPDVNPRYDVYVRH